MDSEKLKSSARSVCALNHSAVSLSASTVTPSLYLLLEQGFKKVAAMAAL